MADELESESAVALLEFKNGRKMTNDDMHVKQEAVDDDEDSNMEIDEDDIPKLGPAALGLQRVGAPSTPKQGLSQPPQVLNARGMPARIRKKNKLYYDDDIINTPHHRVPSSKKSTPISNKKQKIVTPTRTMKEAPKPTPTPKKYALNREGRPQSMSPVPQQSPDRKIGQKIGMRLRNLLKLPKAHKWVCYEWFYSNIDRCLFAGENDFTICLKESFPELKTRDLTRIEWTKVRRMMGKPRRCSQSFFNEERLELEKKRNKIRALQQRKATDMSSFKDLPPEIPMQLVIGTKVTARIRKPQDGLFTGSIDAVDTSNNTYRITFERHGLGTHSVPDYEVLSNEPPDTMTTLNFQHKFRPRNGISPYGSTNKSPALTHFKKRDPLLASSGIRPTLSPVDGHIGSFPVKLLEKIVLVTKILTVKKAKIKLLKSMNTEAEKFSSFETLMPDNFERKYASILIDLEKLNHDLKNYLDEIQVHCHEIAPEPSVAAMLAPSLLREKCREEATEIVQRNNTVIASDKGPVTNASILELITDLTALMLQVKSLSDSDQNAYELQVLQGTMEVVKRKLTVSNQLAFQNHVEVHMKHIQKGLGQASNKSLPTAETK
ncbi:hypothetical protein PPYR_07313 [Photinus pyralis]|uniref:DIRP domain-containing protein n=2 Tax=Photinus pyralis TaxID=7054 RepID=A0A5N4AQ91_PHOPY|nr:protein lin-9 homolog isoform X1 [Photinus pyralis]KAB0799433.1 hypothetical protein PPYR_07313 [Photinus pyralis]